MSLWLCILHFLCRCINLLQQVWGWIQSIFKSMWCGWSSSLWKCSLTSSSLSSMLSLSSGNFLPRENFSLLKKGKPKEDYFRKSQGQYTFGSRGKSMKYFWREMLILKSNIGSMKLWATLSCNNFFIWIKVILWKKSNHLVKL